VARRAASVAALFAFLNALLGAPLARAGLAEDFLVSGNQRYLRGDLDAALIEYEKAIAARPDQADAHYNLGVVYFETGNLDAALDHFQRAAQLDPGRAEAWSNLAIVLCAKGYFDQAEDAARHAIDADPGFGPGWNNLGLVLEAQSRAAEGRKAFDRAVTLTPGKAEALNNVGNALARAGRNEAAMSSYDRALAENGRLAYVYFNRGLLALRLGDQNGAVRDWEKARRIDPTSAPDFAIASVALRGGDYTRAIRHFEAASSRRAPAGAPPVDLKDFKPLFAPQGIEDPRFPRSRSGRAKEAPGLGPKGDPGKLSREYGDLGQVNLDRGLDDRAQKLLEDAIELDAGNESAREALGRLYLKRGRPEEAVSVLQPIERTARRPQLLVLLGSAYERASRLEDALRVYGEAVKLDPKSASAHEGLGWIRMRTRNYDGGLAELRKSVDLAPHDSHARVTLADSLQIIGLPERAEREYERAIRDNPADARAHAHYASFLASEARYTEARRSYAKALAQDPDAPGVADELARLGARRPAKFDSVWEGILLMPILPFLGIGTLFAKLAR
jgi:tetratricopeptide (TPR) repeat protein